MTASDRKYQRYDASLKVQSKTDRNASSFMLWNTIRSWLPARKYIACGKQDNNCYHKKSMQNKQMFKVGNICTNSTLFRLTMIENTL